MAKGMSSSGKPSTNMTPIFRHIAVASEPCPGFCLRRGDLALRLLADHLPATIHAGFQVDVMRTAQFAGILVLDIGRSLQRIGRTAHAALSRRRFSFWHGHGVVLLCSGSSSSEWRAYRRMMRL